MNEQDYPPLPKAVREVITLHQPTEYTEHVVTGAHYTADQMRAYADASIAQQSARHAEELLAYEVTADNLKQDRDLWAARCASEVAKVANLDQRLKRDAKRHAEELLAYEVTVGNLRAQREQAQPVATLHDDGYWTWKQGRPPHVSNYAGWRMDVYAAPQAQPERKPMTEDEMLEGRERTFSVDNPYCPCDRKMFMKVARYVEAFHGIFGGKP